MKGRGILFRALNVMTSLLSHSTSSLGLSQGSNHVNKIGMLQMLGTGPSMTKERFEDVAGRLVKARS